MTAGKAKIQFPVGLKHADTNFSFPSATPYSFVIFETSTIRSTFEVNNQLQAH